MTSKVAARHDHDQPAGRTHPIPRPATPRPAIPRPAGGCPIRPDDPRFHELTGAYALNALSDEERLAFERHLDDCDACSDETAELLATSAGLDLDQHLDLVACNGAPDQRAELAVLVGGVEDLAAVRGPGEAAVLGVGAALRCRQRGDFTGFQIEPEQVVGVLAHGLGHQQGLAVRGDRARPPGELALEDHGLLAGLGVAGVDVEVQAVALGRGEHDGAVIRQQAAEEAEGAGQGGHQFGLALAVDADAEVGLLLVAGVVCAVDQALPVRRPAEEGDAVAEGELARLRAVGGDQPQLRLAGNRLGHGHVVAGRRHLRAGHALHQQEAGDIGREFTGETNSDRFRRRLDRLQVFIRAFAGAGRLGRHHDRQRQGSAQGEQQGFESAHNNLSMRPIRGREFNWGAIRSPASGASESPGKSKFWSIAQEKTRPRLRRAGRVA